MHSTASTHRPAVPPTFIPWWRHHVVRPLRNEQQAFDLFVDQLLVDTLRYSHRVQAISDTPLIEETEIIRANARFDATAFWETKFNRISEPVGSVLTTGPGGSSKFRDKNWTYEGGLRKRNLLGGTLDLSQRVGYQNTNSSFFTPPNQGTTQLTLSYNQPLLNGAGKAYNRSLTLLAEINTGIAWDQFSGQLQDELFNVTRAYWELYLERASLLQKQRLLDRAKVILRELEVRHDFDTLGSQIARARAAVATRDSEVLRTRSAVRNAEAKIRTLVNAPMLREDPTVELIPQQLPSTAYVEVNAKDAMIMAIQWRPEVDDALRRVQAAGVRVNMSKNELLPVLDVAVETYVNGLRGNVDIGQAWADQFRQGEPSYSLGLVYELPIQRRAAKAQHLRRMLELRQVTSEMNSTMDDLQEEVEVAVREVRTTYGQIQAKYEAMRAADAEVSYLEARWRAFPGENQSASFLLEDLLNAQERLANEEFGYSLAQLSYIVGLANLNRATGILLRREQVTFERTTDACGNPRLLLKKHGTVVR